MLFLIVGNLSTKVRKEKENRFDQCFSTNTASFFSPPLLLLLRSRDQSIYGLVNLILLVDLLSSIFRDEVYADKTLEKKRRREKRPHFPVLLMIKEQFMHVHTSTRINHSRLLCFYFR